MLVEYGSRVYETNAAATKMCGGRSKRRREDQRLVPFPLVACLVAFWREGNLYTRLMPTAMTGDDTTYLCNYATTQLDERRSITLRKQLNNHYTIVRGEQP